MEHRRYPLTDNPTLSIYIGLFLSFQEQTKNFSLLLKKVCPILPVWIVIDYNEKIERGDLNDNRRTEKQSCISISSHGQPSRICIPALGWYRTAVRRPLWYWLYRTDTQMGLQLVCMVPLLHHAAVNPPKPPLAESPSPVAATQ